MSGSCPTCGQRLPPPAFINTADELVAAMRKPLGRDGKPRDVYETGRDPNKIVLTYGHETVSRRAVAEALRRGLIERAFNMGGYWSVAGARPTPPGETH